MKTIIQFEVCAKKSRYLLQKVYEGFLPFQQGSHVATDIWMSTVDFLMFETRTGFLRVNLKKVKEEEDRISDRIELMVKNGWSQQQY